ncbi:unnamed protein product, partial [Candidula unifasciata]
MSILRLTGTFFGLHLRSWAVLAIGMLIVLTAYRSVSDLSKRVTLLGNARLKL